MDYEVGTVLDEWGVTYTLQMWSVTDIINTITESCDFPSFDGSASQWAYLMASKAGDLHTPALLQKIMDEGFLTPICIYRGWKGAYGIGNGHHRLTCAILLGLDEIPVWYTDTDEYYPHASDGPETITDKDEEVADWLYNELSKVYKKLRKEENLANAEEFVRRFW